MNGSFPRTAATVRSVANDRLADALRRMPTGPVHLVPFIPSGYVSLEATRLTCDVLARAGASALEIGIPFSDPIADGPIIQAAYHETLRAGVTVDQALVAGQPTEGTPRLTMVSYSLVRRRGDQKFLDKVKRLGYAGILCPDLPPPEAERFCGIAADVGVAPVLLVAPTTPPERRELIGRLAGGFIYYLSVAGTTGERDRLPEELAAGVADMRNHTNLPICVGFGVSKPDHVSGLSGIADGAIVGSAFVRAAAEVAHEGPERVAETCASLARRLLGVQH